MAAAAAARRAPALLLAARRPPGLARRLTPLPAARGVVAAAAPGKRRVLFLGTPAPAAAVLQTLLDEADAPGSEFEVGRGREGGWAVVAAFADLDRRPPPFPLLPPSSLRSPPS